MAEKRVSDKKRTAPQSWYDKVEGRKMPDFINYDLTVDEKKRFKEWAHENASSEFDYIEKLVDSGYQVSFKYDKRAECFASFLTCANDKDQNFNWVLSGRGSTAFSAFMGVCFRHWILFEGVWPTETARRYSRDDD